MQMSLHSTNPNFSYILRKNPASGIIVKPLHKGTLFGWFHPDPQTYRVAFFDAPAEVSYPSRGKGGTEFEYLNRSRYTSPLCVTDVCSSLWSSMVKQRDEERDITGFQHMCSIEHMEVNEKYVDIFQKSFPAFALETTPLGHKLVSKITITTTETLYRLANYLSIFAMFQCVKTGTLFDKYIQEDQAKKYFTSLEVLGEVPYLMRYVFKLNILSSTQSMKTYLPLLEALPRKAEEFHLCPYSLYDSRIKFFENHWNPACDVIDIGCGEGQYVTRFAGKMRDSGTTYIAIDTDEECRDIVTGKVTHRDLKNVIVFGSLEEWVESQQISEEKKYVVLLSEVLEHMKYEEAENLLRTVIKHVPCIRIILTLPNGEFNTYFGMDDEETRHEDHHWEGSVALVESLLQKVLPLDWTYDIKTIGDIVNGISASIGVVITPSVSVVNNDSMYSVSTI